MIGSLDKSKKEVTVVGAGVAGLLAAYTLNKQGYDVTLLESKERAGGLIQTLKTDYGIAERAAHSFLLTPLVEEFCKDVGVELVEVRKKSRSRFIVKNGKPSKFPLSFGEAVQTFRKAVFAKANGDESSLNIAEWTKKHLGDAALNYLLTPLVRGIYGAQPADLGLAAAFPELCVPEGKSLIGSMLHKKFSSNNSNGSNGHKEKSRKRMVAPKFGMGDLTSRLEQYLEIKLGDSFKRGVKVDSIPHAPNVILSVPAYAAANLLETESPELSRKLQDIKYTPIVSVTAFVSRENFTKPVSGIGVLVPEVEEREILGILFNSSSFEGRVFDESRHASFTILLGGTSKPDWVNASDDEIKLVVRKELSTLLGIKGEPLQLVISRWQSAIPQYSVELPAVWQSARESWCAKRGHLLFGNYTAQVSLRGMIESVTELA